MWGRERRGRWRRGRDDHGGGEKAHDHGGKDVSGGNELDLELDDFSFEPTVLTGTAGETLTLHLENEGSTEHNFSLTDQGIDQDVEDGGKPPSR